MEIVLAALVAAAVAVAVVLLVQRPRPASADPLPRAGVAPAPPTRGAAAGGGETRAERRDGLEEELRARRAELARLEERLRAREGSLELQGQELSERGRSLDDRQRNLEQGRERLKEAKRQQLRELEQVAGLSAGQARQILLRELEDEVRHDSARVIRQVEEETKRDADRRARKTSSPRWMQRVAGGHAVETTVSVVALKSDEPEGTHHRPRGTNIRALETLTGIDFIIDDTPGAVLLSGFNGVRREIARLTLERLLADEDGRIHPARIEEAWYQARVRDRRADREGGSRPCSRPTSHALHPELIKLLGRLVPHQLRAERAPATRSRRAAGRMIAAELGADARRRQRGPPCCTTSARP